MPFHPFLPFPRKCDRQWKKAYRVRLRPNCKKCRQVGPKPLPHAPITFKDFIQTPCRAISSISSHFQNKSDRRRRKARQRQLRPSREKCRQIGLKPLQQTPITSKDLIQTLYHAISSIHGHFQHSALWHRRRKDNGNSVKIMKKDVKFVQTPALMLH